MPYKYTEQQLIEAVKNSTSIRQILFTLGLKQAGGNYQTINALIVKLNLDISHFKSGYDCNKGKIFGPKRPIEDYLDNNHYIHSHALKRRLIKEGIFTHECSKCKLSSWLNLPIPLELDHMDGNHFNNNLSNLRLLCPNCHAQTDNYRGKKLRIKRDKIYHPRTYKVYLCQKCGSKCSKQAKICRLCNKIRPLSKKPSLDQLLHDLQKFNHNISAISRHYNVSNTAVRKWLKSYKILKSQ